MDFTKIECILLKFSQFLSLSPAFHFLVRVLSNVWDEALYLLCESVEVMVELGQGIWYEFVLLYSVLLYCSSLFQNCFPFLVSFLCSVVPYFDFVSFPSPVLSFVVCLVIGRKVCFWLFRLPCSVINQPTSPSPAAMFMICCWLDFPCFWVAFIWSCCFFVFCLGSVNPFPCCLLCFYLFELKMCYF